MYNHYTVSSICTVFLLVNGDALSMNANRFSENERCVAWQLQKFVKGEDERNEPEALAREDSRLRVLQLNITCVD